jgi:hypothetical protein
VGFWEEDIRISNLYLKSMTVFGMSEKFLKLDPQMFPQGRISMPLLLPLNAMNGSDACCLCLWRHTEPC